MMELGKANKQTVTELYEALTATFEKFVSEREISYVDGLMGCHNFYKRIIFDLEDRCNDKNNVVRRTAIDTLALALGIPTK